MPSLRTLSALLLATPVALTAFAGAAAAEEDFFEPRSLAMGGAVRIGGGDTGGVHLNPAVVAQERIYRTSASYQLNVREKGHRFAIGASDGKTSAFGMGTKYSIHTYEPPFEPALDVRWYQPGDLELEDRRTTHRWDIAFAYGFAEKKINVGVAARVIRQDNVLRDNLTRFTLDAGMTFWPVEIIGFGFAAQNLIPTTMNRFPVRLAPGFVLKIGETFRIEVDGVFDFTSHPTEKYADLHAGAEVVVLSVVSLRGGFYSDKQFLDTFVTWGLGVTLNQLRIDFGARIEVGDMDKRLRADKPDSDSRVMISFGVELAFK